MTVLQKPVAYKPSMWFDTKCTYCGEKFHILGHAAFTEVLNKHRETCKETNKGKPKRKRQTGNNEVDKTNI